MIKDERNMMVMNEKKKVFEEYHALKALMIMAVPAIICQLITLIYNIADSPFFCRFKGSQV